ncbi:MAG: FAD-dependent thymidylate synthase [Thermodesulfobacteriota bacterium]
MKIISPSWEIMEDLDTESPAIRIEKCGRLCYKSEDKITMESAPLFIKKIIEQGHNSVVEMAVVTLQIDFDLESQAGHFFAAQPRFFQIDRLEKKRLLVTGSMRAFRELYIDYGRLKIVKAAVEFLAGRYPLFFEDLLPRHGLFPQQGIEVRKVPLAEVDQFSIDLKAKHRYIAVKFTVNRAVSHEIVRHRPCSFLQESQRYCRYSNEKFGSQVTFIKPMFFTEGSPEYKQWFEAMSESENIYLKLLETVTPQAARTVLPNSCKTEIIVYANLLEWLHIFRLRTSKGADPSMREVMIPLLSDFKAKFPGIFDYVVV